MRSLYILALCALFFVTTGREIVPAHAQRPADEWQRHLDLRGPWLFQIGDDARWAEPDWDDSGWDEIYVPSPWEDEGYPGYDGYAWYRRHFRLDPSTKGRALYLRLGRIDDVDEVFVNGMLIGATGGMPPDYRTAYQHDRIYRIPENALRYGRDNVIAVRVYDSQLEGGPVEGQVGLFERTDDPVLAVDLAGAWRFRPGDDLRWKDEKYPDGGWSTIQVPAWWEPQGHRGMDGYAWYRVRFVVPERYRKDDLVLLLGRIDDLDEAYLNGVRVGRTGDLERRRIDGDEYRRMRVYPLPRDLVRFGSYNTLAVRVYDGRIDGGIYEGPVGIATHRSVARWRDEAPGMWKYIQDWLFDK